MKPGRLQPSQGKRSARPKKAAARRDWVSTVNDLSVHKSTPAELVHRHEIHKSHNSAVAQWELKEKSVRRRHRVLGTPSPMDQASLSIIREVFSDQLLLQDVLARSDRAMAVVKDLFGDAPRRQTGHPRVTMAPDCDSDSELPVVRRADPPTQLSLLSHTTMNQQALNDLEECEGEHREEEPPPAAVTGQRPRSDLCRMRTRSGPGGGPPGPRAKPSSRSRGWGASGQTPPLAPATAPDPAGLNTTVAVQRVCARTSQSEAGQEAGPGVQDSLSSSARPGAAPCRQRKTPATPRPAETPGPMDGSAVSLSGTRSSLDLLQGMLGRVEEDLDSMGPQEPEREGQPSSGAGPTPRTQGLTGFSVALVSTLGRVVQLLRQREEEAQREVGERRRLEEVVLDQRGLIDALSAESLALREESAALQVCLLQRTSELEQRLDTVVQALGGVDLLGGLLGAPNDSLPLSHSPDYGSDSLYAGFEPRLTQGPASSAVLLSPPQQRDHLPHGPPERGPSPRYDRPRHGARGLREVASLSSSTLPPAPVTSDPEGRPALSEEALVAEITRLSQQNQRIKEQLTQARALGSALSCSPDPGTATASSSSSSSSSSSQARGSWSSGSTGPGARGGRAESAGPQRETQQDPLTGGGPLQSPEAAGSCASSGGSVERRLLELNRQSAAARGRLLELIEQQKQSASPVSPSISPIPPSAFSPLSEGGRTPESSISLPDQQRSQGRAGNQLLAAVSQDSRWPKEGGGDGWFALSSHLH
ncbi:spindle and centriole-associated protein 1 isoform X2 [Gadus morhua]|uniref:spindle and centriole-associated protein 1 isoform X2 n=1 Tax=Gadus morhua TaxID=8049 RepID=UPI0011B393FD|nr:spindle and centriole-associated protein 1 isoform X2 [Gadus morhua]